MLDDTSASVADASEVQHQQQAPPSRPATPIPVPCKFFAMGTCKHGAECRFMHNVSHHWYPNHDQSGSGESSRGRGYARAYRPIYVPHHHQPYYQGQGMGWDRGRGRGRGRGGRGRGGFGGRGRGRGGYTPEPVGTRPGPESKRGERVEQPYDYFLVLDLEGKDEIIEFPVALVDAKTLEVVDRFHRYCVPVTFPEDRLKAYITTKYGKWGLADKWFESAISFVETLSQFQAWMAEHKLTTTGGKAESTEGTKEGFSFAFVTCGNWDIKTQIPKQCRTSGIAVPSYFHQWINLKDVYLNFYAHRALGMAEMLNGLSIKMQGNHHSGADDVENITTILIRIINDGAKVEVTASRADEHSPITYKYASRI